MNTTSSNMQQMSQAGDDSIFASHRAAPATSLHDSRRLLAPRCKSGACQSGTHRPEPGGGRWRADPLRRTLTEPRGAVAPVRKNRIVTAFKHFDA